MSTSSISPDDSALFRMAVGRVTPLPPQNRAQISLPPKPAIVRDRHIATDFIDTLSDFAPDDVPDSYLGNGIANKTLRKLRNQRIEDMIDLHGMTSTGARQSLQAFLHHANLRDVRTVLIIHGKGSNSPNGESILRKLTRYWLIQHALVLAYCDAPAHLGGTGAVIVLLKSNSPE